MTRCRSASVAFFLLFLHVAVGTDYRPIPDSRAIAKVLKENTGLIEWLIEHAEDVIAELGKASSVDSYGCLVGIAHLIQSLADGKMWALSMVDSSAKVPNGLLEVNLNHLGMYDECIAINSPGGPDPFTGMYCLVDFNIHIPENMTFEIDGITKKLSDLLGSNVIKLSMGQCYPSVCKPVIIQSAMNSVFEKVSSVTKSSYPVQIGIDPHDCHVSSRDALQTSEWLVLMAVCMILFLSGLSTTLDVVFFREKLKHKRPDPGELAAISFSLYTNGKKLFDLKQGSETIRSLNGLKFLSICWVIIGHRYRYIVLEPLINLAEMPHAFKDWFIAFIVSGPLAVDTFFTISGLLNMYMFMKVRATQRPYGIWETLGTYIHRYFRLTPVYALVIAITATLLYRLRDGPVWDRTIRPVQEECQVSWWLNLLYINNYKLISGSYCMLQSWYLSADMQLFWISPLVMYPLWRWPIFGYIQLGVLIVLSVFIPSSIAWYYEIATPVPLTTDSVKRDTEMRELYLPTHTKFTAYVVGLFVGYIIFKIRHQQLRLRMNSTVCLSLWAGSIGLMLYAVLGAYPIIQLNYDYNRYYSSFYIGFYHLFWAAGLAWVLIACETGFGGPVSSLLSWNVFGPLGKLTYCIYLVHIGVMLCDVGSVRQAIYYSSFFEIHDFFGDLLICIIVAIPFSLLVEAPFLTLEKLIFAPSRVRNDAPAYSNVNMVMPVETHPEMSAIANATAPLNTGSTKHLLTSELEPELSESPTDALHSQRGSEAEV